MAGAAVVRAGVTAVWLMRHAPVDLPPGVCYGRLDVPADAAATVAAAQAVVGAWQASNPGQQPLLRHSPRRRCRQLLDAVQDLQPSWPSQVDGRLAEMDFGAWEGRRWSALPAADWTAWMARFADHRCGGAESVRAFMRRVGRAWDAAQARQGPEIWLTHAGVLSAVALLQRGVRVPRRAALWPTAGVPFGAWWVAQGEGVASLEGRPAPCPDPKP